MRSSLIIAGTTLPRIRFHDLRYTPATLRRDPITGLVRLASPSVLHAYRPDNDVRARSAVMVPFSAASATGPMPTTTLCWSRRAKLSDEFSGSRWCREIRMNGFGDWISSRRRGAGRSMAMQKARKRRSGHLPSGGVRDRPGGRPKFLLPALLNSSL